MKALSIRQPWAWLIIHGGKDIENRAWPTKFRGRVLVHAAKGMTRGEYDNAIDPLYPSGGKVITLPSFDDLQRGGIVGSVEITDCVTESDSPWFFGLHGFVLRNPKPLPFTPWRGQLGLFEVPDEANYDQVVHCKKAPYDVYIGRGSLWGNPFVIGVDGSREEVIRKYRDWIFTQPDLMRVIKSLRGKRLGCWCAPLPCHGDVLAELANKEIES